MKTYTVERFQSLHGPGVKIRVVAGCVHREVTPDFAKLAKFQDGKTMDFGPLAFLTECGLLAACIMEDLGPFNDVFIQRHNMKLGTTVLHRLRGDSFTITDRQILDWSWRSMTGDMLSLNAWVETEWKGKL